jgi:hypothetical protein
MENGHPEHQRGGGDGGLFVTTPFSSSYGEQAWGDFGRALPAAEVHRNAACLIGS